MVIKIKPRFTATNIKKMLNDRLKMVDTAIIQRFQYIGERFVKNAREKGTYRDQTGNLRNSIGYIIMRDGVLVLENFRRSASVKKTITRGKNKGQIRITTGSGDGLNTGRNFAYEAAKSYPKGYALIVVAGMEYAAAVESRGKDVLTGSSTEATAELKKAMSELASKIAGVR